MVEVRTNDLVLIKGISTVKLLFFNIHTQKYIQRIRVVKIYLWKEKVPFCSTRC